MEVSKTPHRPFGIIPVMKKVLSILLLLCVAAALVWLAVFSWHNLRGIHPALKRPSRDVSRFIERVEAGTIPADMPLSLPRDFSISLFAKGLGGPRVMVSDPSGTLLVSIPSQGRVVALPDTDRDGVADRIVTVVRGLNKPHGMAFRCAPSCKLYIGEEHQVNSYSYDGKDLRAKKEKKIADLPQGSGHSTRTLLFLPGPSDDQLLISVGSSCNVCSEKDSRRAKILVVPGEGGNPVVFASGLRNAVFMAVHPKTRRVWATEMGRDLLGDNTPPDEINIIAQGRDYGWPFCFGKNIHDDDFDPEGAHSCREPAAAPSHIDIPAHSAPLGLAFFPEEGWPREFHNNLLVAFHGSWNRSEPTGYKIVRYRLDGEGRYLEVKDFVSGWLTGNGISLGRPVDIMIRPDGTIFVSDDKAGVIYRITRKK
jgi:glucose/arabinose dehydrogenase